jgi:hypothetical protein
MVIRRSKNEPGLIDSVLLWLFITEVARNTDFAIDSLLIKNDLGLVTIFIQLFVPLTTLMCCTGLMVWTHVVVKTRQPWNITRWKFIAVIITPGLIFAVAALCILTTIEDSTVLKALLTLSEFSYSFQGVMLIIQLYSGLQILKNVKEMRLDDSAKVINYPLFVLATKFLWFPLVEIIFGAAPAIYVFFTFGRNPTFIYENVIHVYTAPPSNYEVDCWILLYMTRSFMAVGLFAAYCISHKGSFTLFLWTLSAAVPWCLGWPLPEWDETAEHTNRKSLRLTSANSGSARSLNLDEINSDIGASSSGGSSLPGVELQRRDSNFRKVSAALPADVPLSLHNLKKYMEASPLPRKFKKSMSESFDEDHNPVHRYTFDAGENIISSGGSRDLSFDRQSFNYRSSEWASESISVSRLSQHYFDQENQWISSHDMDDVDMLKLVHSRKDMMSVIVERESRSHDDAESSPTAQNGKSAALGHSEL